jgi:hypothetical protein
MGQAGNCQQLSRRHHLLRPTIGEPATPTEMDKPVIDNFNFYPACGRPAVGRWISVNGITTDCSGNARPNQLSIGAAEPGR